MGIPRTGELVSPKTLGNQRRNKPHPAGYHRLSRCPFLETGAINCPPTPLRSLRLNVLHDQLQLALAQSARAGFRDRHGVADAAAAFAFFWPDLRFEDKGHAGLQLNFREALEILVAEQRRTVVAETARVHDRVVP